MSFILPEKVMDRFHFAYNYQEFAKILSPDATPKEYGGERAFSDKIMQNGCPMPKELGKSDYLVRNKT